MACLIIRFKNLSRGRITGHDNHLAAQFRQKMADTHRIALDIARGLVTIRDMGGIAKVHDALVGQMLHYRIGNRKAANA